MQLKAEEFCILITDTLSPIPAKKIAAYTYVYIYLRTYTATSGFRFAGRGVFYHRWHYAKIRIWRGRKIFDREARGIQERVCENRANASFHRFVNFCWETTALFGQFLRGLNT